MIQYSDKQLDSYLNSTSRINIWEGAVRSGKSYICLLRFLKELKDGPEGAYLICGRTERTIKRNIIDPIFSILGENIHYRQGIGELKILGKKVYLVGASDQRAEGKIRGATLAGALIDEVSLIPEAFFQMLLSRLSIKDSKLFATTNPDSPFHWLKTKFLDRSDVLDLKRFKFTLEDNPSLSEEFVNELKKEYQGLWSQRFIEGKWVLAEGAIYDFFDADLHTIDVRTKQAQSYIVGVDYGTHNPTAFVLIGIDPNSAPMCWVEDEYYYDSTIELSQKTDFEFAQDLKAFIQGKNVTQIYIDPAAASFKNELQKQGVYNILDANNKVLDGIRFVSSMFTTGDFKIGKHCKKLIEEISSYSWDEKSRDLGIERPKKTNDHCFVAGTKVLTIEGPQNIEDTKPDNYVLTRSGPKKVVETFSRNADVYQYTLLGKEVTCTPEHKIFTINGWKKACDMMQSDMLIISLGASEWERQYDSKVSTTIDIQNQTEPLIDCITELERETVKKDVDIFIETFGNSIMEKFHPNTIFITSTEIHPTMTLATLSVSTALNTFPIIKKILLKNRSKLEKIISIKYDRLQKNGMPAKKVENGIESMDGKDGKTENISHINASNVEMNIKQKTLETINFVRISAKVNGEEILELMMRKEFVPGVMQHLSLINTTPQEDAPDPVDAKLVGEKKVYNLHIQDDHEYFVENILVHNCCDATRYGIFSHFKNLSREDDITAEDIRKLERYNENSFYYSPPHAINW